MNKITIYVTVVAFVVLSHISCSIENRSHQIIPLPDLSFPDGMVIFNDALYITHAIDKEEKGSYVFVYPTQDFRLKTQFGGDGDDPGKFQIAAGHSVWVSSQGENITVNDGKKIGFFTPDGKFLREVKTEGASAIYRALDRHFAAQGSLRENDIAYYTVNLYGSDLKKLKEVYRIDNQYQPSTKKSRIFTYALFFQPYKNHIYVKGRSVEFVMDVYDADGKHIRTIKQDCPRERVTEEHKQSALNGYKNHPLFGKFFNQIKEELIFPEYLPAMKEFRVADDRIYVLTYRREEAKNEFYILDLNGHLIMKKMVSFHWQDSMVTAPFDIQDGKLYQLVKNKKMNIWDLHVIHIL